MTDKHIAHGFRNDDSLIGSLSRDYIVLEGRFGGPPVSNIRKEGGWG